MGTLKKTFDPKRMATNFAMKKLGLGWLNPVAGLASLFFPKQTAAFKSKFSRNKPTDMSAFNQLGRYADRQPTQYAKARDAYRQPNLTAQVAGKEDVISKSIAKFTGGERDNIIDPSGKVNQASMFGGLEGLINRDKGSILQGTQKGLSDYMFGKGMKTLRNLPASEKVWMAHGPKPDDYAKLAKTGFSGVRPASKLTNLVSPRAWEQILQGKNPLASTGVYTAVGKTKADALKAAGRFAKGPLTRGVGATGDLSKVFTGQVPRSTFPISSGVLRTPQMEVPSHIANRAFNIGDKGARLGAMPAKGMIKGAAGRLLPGVGAALGAASAAKHFQGGDYGRAALAGLSMAPGPLGWAGLAGEYGLSALDKAMMKYRQNPNAPENTLVMNKGGRIDKPFPGRSRDI